MKRAMWDDVNLANIRRTRWGGRNAYAQRKSQHFWQLKTTKSPGWSERATIFNVTILKLHATMKWFNIFIKTVHNFPFFVGTNKRRAWKPMKWWVGSMAPVCNSVQLTPQLMPLNHTNTCCNHKHGQHVEGEGNMKTPVASLQLST